ncbi:PAS domain S-box-containing protein [Nakamurella sp. UYEF19]|uniref:sensor histidine kinase n=1 Tax=Nakamurella sp. UYEF19 TaxID=1756392 RepID=UPI0033918956
MTATIRRDRLLGGDRPGSAVGVGIDHADSLTLIERHSEVLDLLASGASLVDVLTAVAVALEELIQGSSCSVLLLDGATGTLNHGAAPHLPAKYMAAIDGLSIGPDVGSCGTCAHSRTPVVASDITSDPRWAGFRNLAAECGLRSCWSQPIFGRNGAVLGTFAVYHPEPHVPDDRELRLVGRFVHLSSVAIEHAVMVGALVESEEQFRRAFEDNAVGMAMTDLQGVLTKVNKSLRVMLRCNESDLLGRPLAELVHPDDRAAAAAALQMSPRDDTDGVEFEARFAAADHRSVVVAVTVSAVRAADGTPLRWCVNLLDVTQRRAVQAERQARREAEAAQRTAEAASRAKSDFLAALSHEIRTPLQAVTGFTELLQNLDLSAERRRLALRHIEGAAGHILALVDDVLDIAKIEAGALPLQIELVDLAALVREVVELLRPLADQRTITLHLEADTSGGQVHADRRRLRQVLINVINNGLLYNHPGGWVSLRVDITDGAVVEVSDSGPGIADELRDRLFLPFDRLGADIGGEPGAGLGLALSRALTEAMGGRLMLRSADGGGTTAVVTLRVDDASIH